MTTRAEREEANRRFLKTKVDVHLNKLIIELLKRKPDNVLEFINSWSKDELSRVDTNTAGGDEKTESNDNQAYEVNNNA